MTKPALTLTTAQVLSAADVTPRMRRITLGGNGLREFGGDRPADAVKLILPADGVGAPPEASWGPDGLTFADPDADAALRAYTVRRFDRAAGRLEIDAVVHGHGPGATWAATACPGDPVSFLGPRRDYPRAERPDLLVIAGDETAIPAAAGIAEDLEPGQRAQVFLEVADPHDEVPFASAGDVTVSWLHRRTGASVLAAALRAFRPPPGSVRAWVAAESAVAVSLRKLLRGEFGLPRHAVSAFGYWQREIPKEHS
ncbi:siderophore-interacting protein [Actinokineospora iranica]|uniref:NADPH-dependent ferric siderophore reductase, contains FAD-binding and SIP domains n=1 Tax=Actinokineospora iranica TaxID=1271860 RepID=A0A1G6T8K9_9PSEU|nr:siderophore-interacting protein [Actinokineospora iranica]SDD25381.1 NADPH-dependent ferric siderophore reductase, contains FAD-binding and SIP domains [Actinokineospora iranica]